MIAGIRSEQELIGLLDRYRTTFRPSTWADHPYVVLAVTVAVADTTEQARRLLLPEAWSSAYSRTRGVFPPLQPVDEVLRLNLSEKERGFFEQSLRGQIYGTPSEVETALGGLVQRTAADEVLITTNTYDRAELLDSYRLQAELSGVLATR